MTLENQILQLSSLRVSLEKSKQAREKKKILLSFPVVQKALTQWNSLPPFKRLGEEIAFLSILAIEQDSVVFQGSPLSLKRKIRALVDIDRFYDKIGGIIGYHLFALRCLLNQNKKNEAFNILRAAGLDLTSPAEKKTVLEGIQSIPYQAEIYPMGGLGARLNLQTKNKAPLPVASLPFSGRTLLEGLIRDVQAREYLYYKLFSRQVTIPIAMMTSRENKNHEHIKKICRAHHWFGRRKESFFLFPQLSVPVITEEGSWSMLSPNELNLHPGGHGALWRMAEKKGVLRWVQSLKKEFLLVRQINNPIAGIDGGLLGFVGAGRSQNKTFGFASCERLVNAAEGVLVHVEKEDGSHTISNIEYTDFDAFGIKDIPAKNGFSEYPTNTNILYVDLQKIMPTLQKAPLPGLMMNMKTKVPYISSATERREIRGGRLESMMQNIADSLLDPPKSDLRTYVTYNARQKTISTTKCSYEEGKKISETPEGAFYDLLLNAYELLKNVCKFSLPPFSSPEEYLKKGPSVLFLYHPSLGPLYDIIGQKIQRGKLREGSELQLEITDICIENLELEGSLIISASQIMGHRDEDILRYSHQTGKCRLKNVKIENEGIDRAAPHRFWENKLRRKEALRIYLMGNAELDAQDVIFKGAKQIIVPTGERWVAYQEKNEVLFHKERIEKPSWWWEYQIEQDTIALNQVSTVSDEIAINGDLKSV